MGTFDAFSDDGGGEAYAAYGDSNTAFSSETPQYSAAPYTPSYGDTEEVTEDHANSSDPFGSNPEPFVQSGPVPISNGNGKPGYVLGEDAEGIFSSDGPLLPPPNQMQEEGLALRE